LDQVEECVLRPMDVLERDDERLPRGCQLKEPARTPVDLVERILIPGQSDGRGDAYGRVAVLRSGYLDELCPRRLRRILIVDAGDVAGDLEQRPEGDSAPIREAPAAHEPCLRRDPKSELFNQTRLADAGLRDDGDETADVLVGDGCELSLQQFELDGAADERIVVAPLDRLGGANRGQPICRYALRLALELERLDLLHLDRVPNEPVRRLAQQHLVYRRRLLEPRSRVHRIARDEPLAYGWIPCDDLARVDAGAVSDRDAPATFELL